MLRPLYIFTGMDGCGKSTRVSELEKEKNLKYMYEPLDYRFRSLNELKQLYQDHELMDRFFPLDEPVYSKVWNEKSFFTKEQTLELLQEISHLLIFGSILIWNIHEFIKSEVKKMSQIIIDHLKVDMKLLNI